MQKTFIWIIVLVLIVLGIVLFIGRSNKLEAPTLPENTQTGAVNPGNNTTTKTTVVTTTVTSESAPVREFIVTGQNFSFNPSSMVVKQGDRVKITFNNSQGFHDFRIDEYGVASKQSSSPSTEVLEFTADKVGSFVYYCSVGTHRAMGMLGTLVVE